MVWKLVYCRPAPAKPVEDRRVDVGAEAAELGEPDVVEDQEHHVGRAGPGPARLGPPRDRGGEVVTDDAAELARLHLPVSPVGRVPTHGRQSETTGTGGHCAPAHSMRVGEPPAGDASRTGIASRRSAGSTGSPESPDLPACPRRSRPMRRSEEAPATVGSGRVRARLDELGLVLHGPHPPHDPLDAVVVHGGIATDLRPAPADRRGADLLRHPRDLGERRGGGRGGGRLRAQRPRRAGVGARAPSTGSSGCSR